MKNLSHNALPIALPLGFLRNAESVLPSDTYQSYRVSFKRLQEATQDFKSTTRINNLLRSFEGLIECVVVIGETKYEFITVQEAEQIREDAIDLLVKLRQQNKNHGRGIVFTNYGGVHYNCSIPTRRYLTHGCSLERVLSYLALNGVFIRLTGGYIFK